jgi:predicted nucleotidyltransferase
MTPNLDYIKELILKNNPEQGWIVDNLIFLHIAGSRLYGTNTESSDWDVRGITIAPRSFWVGARKFDQIQINDKFEGRDFDLVIYDIKKWLNLTLYMNPNVIESIFVNYENEIDIFKDKENNGAWWDTKFKILKMLNRKAYSGFKGYSTAQLKKMMVKFSNKSGRQDIVKQNGFDTKFAMHGFRLTRQGAELLSTGNINFPRPDREDLLSIRNGQKYKQDEMDKCVKDWEKEQQLLDEALVNSPLPDSFNFNEYDALLQHVFNTYVE